MARRKRETTTCLTCGGELEYVRLTRWKDSSNYGWRHTFKDDPYFRHGPKPKSGPRPSH